MNTIAFNQILKTANDFVNIAKRVNISSRLRTNHSKEALVSISYCRSIVSNLLDDINDVAQKNINQKDNDVDLQLNCIELKKNIVDLDKLLTAIEKSKQLDSNIVTRTKDILKKYVQTLDNAIEKLETIIRRDNDIIQKDNEIIELKNSQQKLLVELQDNTQKSCNDAIKAVKGSHSNLERGLKMVEEITNIEKHIDVKNYDLLNKLLRDANRGWKIAEEVNISSNRQLEFAEGVYNNTKELHNKSIHIQNLVIDRHKFYAESLKIFFELTEIFSVHLKKHTLNTESIINENFSSNNDKKVKELESKLSEIVDASKNIKSQNDKKINDSEYYSDNEANTVEMTKEEIICFDKIIEEIEFMTETTRYPIEGSNNNITNGQLLGQLLLNAYNDNDVPVNES